MIDFFPEFAGEIQEKKEQITIRHLLQMRGGYRDEEFAGDYFEIIFFHGNWKFLPHLVDFRLSSDPGTKFHYSNLTFHLLGVIVTLACGQDLETYAQQYLFSPMDAELYGWRVDDEGYHWGFGEIQVHHHSAEQPLQPTPQKCVASEAKARTGPRAKSGIFCSSRWK